MAVSIRSGARAIGVSVLAGAIVGFVVGGLGGRLFMYVLAQLNPDAAGVTSDDGFTMGQFTMAGTTGLLAVGTFFGIFGGVLILALRGLRFGPPWFRWLSMPLGGTIVVGSMLVHSDGVDFTLLEPWWLAVGLVLAIPLLYTVFACALIDRWMADRPTFWSHLPPAAAWVARAALTVLAGATLVSLAKTIDEIVRAV